MTVANLIFELFFTCTCKQHLPELRSRWRWIASMTYLSFHDNRSEINPPTHTNINQYVCSAHTYIHTRAHTHNAIQSHSRSLVRASAHIHTPISFLLQFSVDLYPNVNVFQWLPVSFSPSSCFVKRELIENQDLFEWGKCMCFCVCMCICAQSYPTLIIPTLNPKN